MSLEHLIGGRNWTDIPNNNATSAAAIGPLPGSPTAFNSPAPSLAHKSNRIGDNVFESMSGSDNFEGALGDDVDLTATAAATGGGQSKKKYHRHTPFQIEELESYFQINNHPDEKERLEIGRRLSLESKQVKFWFQNRRTQMKTQSERQENNYLKQKYEELLIENKKMKEAMKNHMCTNCGGPVIMREVSMEEQCLRVEVARLKDELNRISLQANKVLGRPTSSLDTPFNPPMPTVVLDSTEGIVNNIGPMPGPGLMETFPIDLEPEEETMNNIGPMTGVRFPFEKSILVDLAMKAMDELVKLAQSEESMWVQSVYGEDTLIHDEYTRTCPPFIGPKPSGFISEASKATGIVIMNSLNLVEMLIDSNQCTDVFPCLVGKMSIIDVILGGTGTTVSRNGALQLMNAEFQVLSHLVPVRQVKFLRFCKKLGEGLWAIADVSIDSIQGGLDAPIFVKCRRLPSGCIIQDMPNGYSKVTWVEHTEYDESSIHNIYRPLVNSGIGFGAQRWLAALQRHCNSLAILMSPTNPSTDISGLTPDAKIGMTKLAHRMTRNFCAGVCATMYTWQLVQTSNSNTNTRLVMRTSNDGTQHELSGLVLSATSSVWVPVTHQNLFNFLRDEQLRSEWDELSNGGPMQELFHIPKGHDGVSRVSLLRSVAANGNQNPMLILQETQSDETGSIIAYAPIDELSMHMILGGGDPASVALFPSGFAIAPHSFPYAPSCGSLLTVGFQILVNILPSAKLTMESVATVNSLIAKTIQRIKIALNCG